MHLPIEGNGAVPLPMDGRQTWMASYTKLSTPVSEFFATFHYCLQCWRSSWKTVKDRVARINYCSPATVIHVIQYNRGYLLPLCIEVQMDSPYCLPLSLPTETHLLHDDKMRRRVICAHRTRQCHRLCCCLLAHHQWCVYETVISSGQHQIEPNRTGRHW